MGGYFRAKVGQNSAKLGIIRKKLEKVGSNLVFLWVFFSCFLWFFNIHNIVFFNIQIETQKGNYENKT